MDSEKILNKLRALIRRGIMADLQIELALGYIDRLEELNKDNKKNCSCGRPLYNYCSVCDGSIHRT